MDPLMPGFREDQIHMADYDGDQSQGGWGSGPPQDGWGGGQQQGSQWGGGQQQGSQWGGDQQQGSQWGSDQQQGSQWGGDQQQGSQWGGDQQQGSQWGGQQPVNLGGGPPPLQGFGGPPPGGGGGCVKVFVIGLVMLMMLSAAGLLFFSSDIAKLIDGSGDDPATTRPAATRVISRNRTTQPREESSKDDEKQDEQDDEKQDEQDDEKQDEQDDEKDEEERPEVANIRLGSYPVQQARDLTGDEVPELLGTRFGNDGDLLVVALDGAFGSLLWELPIEGEDTGQPLVQQLGDTVVAVRGKNVTAIAAETGKQVWSAELPDSSTYQSVVMGPKDASVAAIHTNDNSLTGFDLKTGKQVWQTTLKETSYKRFQQLGDRACTEGRDESDNFDEVQCYDLATGELREKVQLGEWSDEKSWWPDQTAEEPTLYRFKGQTFQTMDLARLKLADASEIWSRSLGKDFAVARAEDMPVVQDGDRIAFAAENKLGIVAAGGVPAVTTQEEMALYPLAFDGDLLYVAAIKQRGTRTISVQGVDAASGEVRWQSDALADADPRFGEEEATWKVVPGVGLIFGWDDEDDVMHMTLFDAAGKQAWDHTEQLFISEPPAVFGTNAIVYGAASGTLVALEPKSGKLLWKIGS